MVIVLSFFACAIVLALQPFGGQVVQTAYAAAQGANDSSLDDTLAAVLAQCLVGQRLTGNSHYDAEES